MNEFGFHNFLVMAGLDPAIHVFAYSKQIVDARHKAGHDEALLEAAPNARSGQLAVLLLQECRIRGFWLRWGMAICHSQIPQH
jgi:hypothetical protein